MSKPKQIQEPHDPAPIAQVNGLAEAGARVIPELEIVDDIFLLACRGGQENLNFVIKRVHAMNIAEIPLQLQGAFRLQEWLADALVARRRRDSVERAKARVGTNKHPRGPDISHCRSNEPMYEAILLPWRNL